MLSFHCRHHLTNDSLFTAGCLTGFDASGHIAEETKNARVVAGRGILTSAAATATFGFATTMLFLFCTPDLDILFSLDAPQPFVQLYALALGKPGSAFMTALAVLGLILVCDRRCMNLLGKMSDSANPEYQCGHCRSIPSCVRCGARWRATPLRMDWSGRLSRATQERRYRHVYLWCHYPLQHPSQSSCLLLLGFCWWCPHHRGLWVDWLAPLDQDSERLQGILLLPGTLQACSLRNRRSMVCPHCCGMSHEL